MLVLFDDILVYSRTLEEHREHLLQVFEVSLQNKLMINLKKSSFGQPRLEYLGNVVSGVGVEVDSQKIEAVVKWPKPRNVCMLHGLLGLAGY